MNVGHVQGGTHAGWKIQKPAPKPWHCMCIDIRESDREGVAIDLAVERQQPAYMGRCDVCGERRP